MVTVPMGLPGTTVQLELDSLSVGLLLLAFIAGTFSLFVASMGRRVRPAMVVVLAGTVLALLAANLFTLLAGIALLGVGSARSPREAAATSVAIVGLIVAFAIAGSAEFGALRASAPEAWRVAIAALPMLLAALALLPWSAWRTPAPDAPGALATACAIIVAFYLLARLLFDLLGAASLSWCGIVLLVIGAAAALAGSVRAAVADELHAVVSIGSLHQLGLVLVCLGLALIARGVDLPTLVLLALDAAWLQVVSLTLGRTLLVHCASAAQVGAGTRRLDLLGGLIHPMPIVAGCTLVALLATLALPPSLGFAAFWLLFQALLGVARSGGFVLPLLLAIVAGCVGLAGALAGVGAVRLFGIAFLGRPRTPRAAAAEDATRWIGGVLIVLAALLVLLGLFPAVALLPMRGALARLSGAVDGTGLPLVLASGEEMPGYAPLAIGALLLLGVGAVLWLLHRFGPSERSEPAWSGGFEQPPVWLPFGDPAAQISARSFAEPLRQFAHVPCRMTVEQLRRLAARRAIPPPIPTSLGVLVAVLIAWLLLAA